jgi:hypothetical protein
MDSFPVTEDVEIDEELDKGYIYGVLDFGVVQREVIAFPQADLAEFDSNKFLTSTYGREEETNIKSMSGASVPIGYKSCLLSGCQNINMFKESLTTGTFVLQLHTDSLCDRIFSEKHMDVYNEAVNEQFNSNNISKVVSQDEVSPSPRAKGGGKKSKAPTPEQTPRTPRHKISIEESTLPLSHLDTMVLDWVSNALTDSVRLNSHGTVKFRLEHLLEKSTDMLMEFQKTRTGVNNSNLNLVISEDLKVNIKPARPSKPERWHMPTEISLKSALMKSKQDKMDKTQSATGTMSATGTLRRKKKKKIPLFEQYKEFETVFMLSAELHRKYKRPEKEETVLGNAADSESAAENTRPNTSASVNRRSSSRPTTSDVPASQGGKRPHTHKEETALDRKLAITPFSRMVIIFKYDDNETLDMINDAMQAVNSRALPDIQGTLRSYGLSKEEIDSVNDAKLDLVCGFMILDDETRLVVLEGLGGIGLGMHHIFADIPRMKPNDNSLKILCNPEILFPKRLYTEFGPDLKRVRPREKLKKLAKKPELYNRKQVDEDCFEAIDKLMTLRRSGDLKVTKELDAFPSAKSIGMLELLYGDALSKLDLDGSAAAPAHTTAHNTVSFEHEEGEEGKEGREVGDNASASAQQRRSRQPKSQRAAPTDSRNPDFDSIILNRDPTKPRVDYLKENREIRMAQWANALNRMAEREAEDDATIARVLGIESGKGVKISAYSGQRQNFTEKLMAEQRTKLNTMKNATFTHSQEFLSQTVQLVDEEVDKKVIAENEHKKWTTKRGFVYPPPKNRRELLEHPKRPNDARIAELNEPFESFPVDHSKNNEQTAKNLELERNFTVTSVKDALFGMLDPPEFHRPFELNLVGNQQKLPRGNITGGFEKNDHFWQSVHLHGEKSAKVQKEAEEKEIAEWKSKVVVDHLDFKVGGYKVRDKAIQMDRTHDILKGEAKEKSLIKIRNMKSHSGKDLSYSTAPLSLLGSEKYVPNAAAKALVRAEDKTQFVTTKQTGTASDFTRYIHHSTGKPTKQMAIARRKHPPLNSSDKKGAHWDPPDAK